MPPGSASTAPERDLRLDACRGLALWFILLDHIPDNVGSWLTLSHYGFSDTTEVFMFVSGFTCALAYGTVQQRDGWGAAISHTLRRGAEIYAAFIILVVALVALVVWSGIDQLADDANVKILFEQPGPALAHAAILQYRPVNTDVLPTFVLFHLLFAPLLWLLSRAPHSTLAASALLYLLVQIFAWNLPQWPKGEWYFNPLAWQLLLVLGAWWSMAGNRFLPWVTSRVVVILAVAYLVFGFIVVLGWSVKPLEALIPQAVASYIYPIDKSSLHPLRLLHFLALAVLVARFVPMDWRWLTSPALKAAIRCGENSLEIYCVGAVLSLAAAIVLIRISGGVAAQVAVSLGGIVLLVAVATVTTWIANASRKQPRLF